MLREFTDRYGTRWRVWDINPDARPSRRGRPATLKTPAGWLCFEGGDERRRLSPIPPDWTACDDAALEALCASAEAVPRMLRDLDSGEA